jgi:hypothetical protein
MIENGDVAMDPIEGSDKGTIERRTAHGLSGRRAAIKKLALGAGAAGAVWAAPAINGTSVVPAVAGAQTTLPPIIEGTPTSGLCAEKYSSAATRGLRWEGQQPQGHYFRVGRHWNFYFQGCSIGNTESVALAAGPGPNIANATTSRRLATSAR